MEISGLGSFLVPPTSPIEEIMIPDFQSRGVRLLLKRDDKIPGILNGNKYRKLRLNLLNAREEGYQSLATCGGAYSNHLLALSVAGKEFGFDTFGFVRGEEPKKRSSVLKKCEKNGMVISWVGRAQYRMRESPEFPISWMADICEDAYWVPEGGTNKLAVASCSHIVDEIDEDFDYLCLPCGTGGTFAGCLSSLVNRAYGIGIPVLKGGEYLTGEIKKWLSIMGVNNNSWHLDARFHFGGFAKTSNALVDFAERFFKASNYTYKPDLVYNAKALYGVFQLVREGAIPQGAKVIYLVTQSQ